jgi:hypothetical protein
MEQVGVGVAEPSVEEINKAVVSGLFTANRYTSPSKEDVRANTWRARRQEKQGGTGNKPNKPHKRKFGKRKGNQPKRVHLDQRKLNTAERGELQVRITRPSVRKSDGTTLIRVELVAPTLLTRRANAKPGEKVLSPFMHLPDMLQGAIEVPSQSIEFPYLGLELPAYDTGNSVVRDILANAVSQYIGMIRSTKSVREQAVCVFALHQIEELNNI